jgi:ribonuclease VapC
MIVADSSALVAIAFREQGHDFFFNVINAAPKVLLSTVSVVESKVVVYARKNIAAIAVLENILVLPFFETIPPTNTDATTAYQAFIKYGKGQGHKAELNLGDLFSYALAKNRDLPLLFKGNDFAHTDVKRAL